VSWAAVLIFVSRFTATRS